MNTDSDETAETRRNAEERKEGKITDGKIMGGIANLKFESRKSAQAAKILRDISTEGRVNTETQRTQADAREGKKIGARI